ncbi:uncharacterized protein MONBRDRAFT_32941 [Monosiga brevicollis MX1]|uniref:Uncharacterized protein n=1 Tax=Monosiga brevicollis TaxID=81824 RepID=A9V2N2_MONBE|nr:uncharacterized protein MONBRDRAFT_32941 [Monosiga brevicollis MX1]EDQ88405.1 predicted protein [Monosiga brevicollis MX1]|eukprot:XP_001746998.1 hypothetical protein [Monosiga brevicollis MX1]
MASFQRSRTGTVSSHREVAAISVVHMAEVVRRSVCKRNQRCPSSFSRRDSALSWTSLDSPTDSWPPAHHDDLALCSCGGQHIQVFNYSDDLAARMVANSASDCDSGSDSDMVDPPNVLADALTSDDEGLDTDKAPVSLSNSAFSSRSSSAVSSAGSTPTQRRRTLPPSNLMARLTVALGFASVKGKRSTANQCSNNRTSTTTQLIIDAPRKTTWSLHNSLKRSQSLDNGLSHVNAARSNSKPRVLPAVPPTVKTNRRRFPNLAIINE